MAAHAPLGLPQMPQLALQQTCPALHVFLPQLMPESSDSHF
jgi:hypothetical protein